MAAVPIPTGLPAVILRTVAARRIVIPGAAQAVGIRRPGIIRTRGSLVAPMATVVIPTFGITVILRTVANRRRPRVGFRVRIRGRGIRKSYDEILNPWKALRKRRQFRNSGSGVTIPAKRLVLKVGRNRGVISDKRKAEALRG